VALTFDDGPDDRFTPALLDALGELHVPATFFCVGRRAERRPDLVRRMVDEGHAVGSHSWSHADPGTLGSRGVWRDYARGHTAVARAAKRRVRLFRPPKGHLDRRGAVVARALRLETWLWTVDGRDWEPGASAATICQEAATLEPGGVLLLHDGLEQPLDPSARDRTPTLEALHAIVASARRRGLEFTTLGG
jgi:peptidoglycan/xylan/chitin deacetylase (PgdA/CDA1 family)